MQRNFRIALANNFYSEPVHLSQYDTNYNIVFEVMEKTSKAPINGMTAYFEGTRCDGLSFRYSGTASDNFISFTIDTALTAVSGRHTGEIVLYDGSGLWFGSANVQILVEKAARPDNAVDADVESQQTLLEQITTLAEQTEDAADAVINMTVSAQTLGQGEQATVTKTEQGGVVNLAFGIPAGSQGEPGATGATPNLTVGNVTTLEPNASATASITGTAEDPVLNLGIPRGQMGEVTEEEFSALKEYLTQTTDMLPTHEAWVDITVTDNKRWDYYNGWQLKDASGYYAINFVAEANAKYTIKARNIGTNTTFACGFFNGSTLISSIIDAPSSAEHKLTVTAPESCTEIKFTTNNKYLPPIKVTKKEIGKLDIVYVSLSGSDDLTGEKTHPFQTIQKAIDSNLSDTIVLASGRYQAQISVSNKKKLHLIGAVDGTTVIDYTTTITPTAGSSGVKEAVFSTVESDAIYKVFVSKELSISQTGNATAYTVNLWSYDGLTLMIPKETLAEVQSTENTWTYDGSKIYVNGSGSAYKLVNSYTDNGAYFSNIQDLTLENINVKYAGYNNCKIENCNNIRIIGCDFSNSGRQHGITIDNSNGTIEKCTAFRNCYDGFNIHNKGNTVFIDCESGHNRDDGMSHHDGSTGTVIGGKYHHNHKGGISPTYDAKVNIYNALCSSNGYGIYYSTVTAQTECIVSGCCLVGNNGYGLRVVGYDITSMRTIYSDNNSNSKADGGGSIYNL